MFFKIFNIILNRSIGVKSISGGGMGSMHKVLGLNHCILKNIILTIITFKLSKKINGMLIEHIFLKNLSLLKLLLVLPPNNINSDVIPICINSK